MKKPVFTLPVIFLLLAIACATPRAGVDTQIPTTQMALATLTPLPPTSTDIPTSIASTQQPNVLRLERLQMIDANVGWGEGRVSSAGQPFTYDTPYRLLRTTDGGETWQDVTPPVRFSSPGHTADIAVFAIDADTALAFPPDYLFSEDPPYMLVWRTTDGGKAWRPSNPIDTSDSSILLGVSPRPQYVDEKHGWLTLYFEHRSLAYYLDYRTNDGGITWEHVESCRTWDGGPVCETPLFTDAQTGWLNSPPGYTSTGEEDLTTVWRVQRTLDGGATWQTVDLPHARENLYCYKGFRQAGAGMVALRATCYTSPGEESYYYLSADRGQSWQIIPLPETVSKTGQIFFLDATTGWRISTAGSAYQLERTLNGGVTWQAMGERVNWQEGFQFVDANTGWVVSNDGLQRTTDGGKTWEEIKPLVE